MTFISGIATWSFAGICGNLSWLLDKSKHANDDIQGVPKQAENGLQSRSSENGSVALRIKIAVILNWI